MSTFLRWVGAAAIGAFTISCSSRRDDTVALSESAATVVPASMCCATATATPGCKAALSVESCVCAVDPSCCSGAWSATCADRAVTDCASLCTANPGPTPPSPVKTCEQAPALPSLAPELTSTAAVGSLEGTLSGTPTGGAHYSVAIELPPAPGGFGPSISIEYDSQSNIGILGVGATVSGMSRIHRCSRALEPVGGVAPTYCLDGAPLLNIGGDSASDDQKIEGKNFRVQGDPYTEVIGEQNWGFRVRSRNGNTRLYGGTAASIVKANNVGYIFALRQSSDVHANTIAYAYTKQDAPFEWGIGLWPASISYGNPARSVGFNYRAGVINGETRYDGGVAYAAPPLLGSIVTKVGAAVAREVRFTHQTNARTGRQLLTAVEHCAADGTCQPATKLTWDSGTTRFRTVQTAINPWHMTNGIANRAIAGWDYTVKVLDFNGDGRDDVAFPKYDLLTRNYHWCVLISSGESLGAPICTSAEAWPERGASVGDFNLDGKDDLFVQFANEYQILTSNGRDNFSVEPLAIPLGGAALTQLIDFNGDGLLDFVGMRHDAVLGYNQAAVRYGTPNGFAAAVGEPIDSIGWDAHFSRGGDVDGDGRDDMRVCRALPAPRAMDCYVLAYSKGRTINGRSQVIRTINAGTFAQPGLHNAQLLDANGDGIQDAWFVNNDRRVNLRLGTGEGFLDVSNWAIAGEPTESTIATPIDYNNDGLVDMLVPGANRNWDVLLSTGSGFRREATAFEYVNTAIGNALPGANQYADHFNAGVRKITVLDINGDGLSDFLHVPTMGQPWRIELNTGSKGEVITNIETGLKQKTIVQYNGRARMSDDAPAFPYPAKRMRRGQLLSGYFVERADVDVRETSFQFEYEDGYFDSRTGATLGFRTRRFYHDLGFDTLTSSRLTEFHEASGTFPFASISTSVSRSQRIIGDFGGPIGFWVPRESSSTYALRSYYNGRIVYADSVQSVDRNYDIYDARRPLLRSVVTDTRPIANGPAEGYLDSRTVNVFQGDSWLSRAYEKRTYESATAAARGLPTRVETTNATAAGELDHRVDYEYDAATLKLKVAIAEPAADAKLRSTSTYLYDGFGNPTSVSHASLNEVRTTTTAYDASGTFPICITNPLGHKTAFAHDPLLGALRAKVDPNGLVTTIGYDGFARPRFRLNPDGTRETTDYALANNGKSLVVATTASGSPVTIAEFDFEGQLLRNKVQTPGGRFSIVERRYYPDGQLFSESAPRWEGDAPVYTTFTRDELFRLRRVRRPDGTVNSVNYPGLKREITNGRGQRTTESRDALGQLTDVTDALGGTIRYRYDAEGRVDRVTDAAQNVTSLTYDLLGRKLTQQEPNAGALNFSYSNAFASRTTVENARGQLTTTDIDKLSREIRRVGPEGTTTWEHDTRTIGALASARHSNGYVERNFFDAQGRVTTAEITHIDRTVSLFNMSYDRFGRLEGHSFPAASARELFGVRYLYDATGSLSHVVGMYDEVTYWERLAADAQGRVTRERLGNGAETVTTFDPLSQAITALSTTGPNNAQLQAWTFKRDANHNLTERKRGNDPAERFTYDALDRLSSVTPATGSQVNYQYNRIGNITSRSDLGSYEYPAAGAARPNAVTRINPSGGAAAWQYQYDASGNQIQGPDRQFTYASFNKPTTISRAGQVTTLSYGPANDRIRRLDVDGTETFYYGKQYERIRQPNGSIKHLYYVAALGRTVAVEERVLLNAGAVVASRATTYLHQDTLGSVEAASAAAGQVRESRRYSPFGAPVDATNRPVAFASAITNVGFGAHRHVGDVIDMGGRYYDPVIGRFLSPDPLAYSPSNTQALNRYTYGLNSPMRFVDPSGYQSVEARESVEVGEGPDGGFFGLVAAIPAVASRAPEAGRQARDAGRDAWHATERFFGNLFGGGGGGSHAPPDRAGGPSPDAQGTYGARGYEGARVRGGGPGCGAWSAEQCALERQHMLWERDSPIGNALPGSHKAAEAAQFWADEYATTGNPAAGFMGGLATLYAPEQATGTALGLVPFGKIGKAAWTARGLLLREGTIAPNLGFLTKTTTVIPRGTLVGREGLSATSDYLAPAFQSRSLGALPGAPRPYHVFEVMVDTPALGGRVLPWYRHLGLGQQWKTFEPIQTLVDRGILREL